MLMPRFNEGNQERSHQANFFGSNSSSSSLLHHFGRDRSPGGRKHRQTIWTCLDSSLAPAALCALRISSFMAAPSVNPLRPGIVRGELVGLVIKCDGGSHTSLCINFQLDATMYIDVIRTYLMQLMRSDVTAISDDLSAIFSLSSPFFSVFPSVSSCYNPFEIQFMPLAVSCQESTRCAG